MSLKIEKIWKLKEPFRSLGQSKCQKEEKQEIFQKSHLEV